MVQSGQLEDFRLAFSCQNLPPDPSQLFFSLGFRHRHVSLPTKDGATVSPVCIWPKLLKIGHSVSHRWQRQDQVAEDVNSGTVGPIY